MKDKKKVALIHASFINGQKKAMVEMIDEYGVVYFWQNLAAYLRELYPNYQDDFENSDLYERFDDFIHMVDSYFKIKGAWHEEKG